MSYQVRLGQSLKKMMQSEFQDRLGHQKSIFTNDISLILDGDAMIGYILSHAPPRTALIFILYIVVMYLYPGDTRPEFKMWRGASKSVFVLVLKICQHQFASKSLSC